jgi:hypothetical protein
MMTTTNMVLLKTVRLGFLAGQTEVPDDFDQMGSSDITELFELERAEREVPEKPSPSLTTDR